MCWVHHGALLWPIKIRNTGAAIRIANADKRAAAILWKEVHKAPDKLEDLVAQLDDPGFEFTTRPQRIGHFTASPTASAP